MIRLVRHLVAVVAVGLVILSGVDLAPRRLDFDPPTVETPAPRPAHDIPSGSFGSSAEADRGPTGAPALPGNPAAGAPTLGPRNDHRIPTARPSLVPSATPRASRPPARRVTASTGGHSPKPTRLPLVVHVSGNSIAGQATWYCLPGRSACTAGYDPACTCAAAGTELQAALGPRWRGASVTVISLHPRASVHVRLVDSCACPGDHVIDLFASTFAQLGSLSSGELDVAVEW